MKLNQVIELVSNCMELSKRGAAPRPGLVWNEQHHRWMRPKRQKAAQSETIYQPRGGSS